MFHYWHRRFNEPGRGSDLREQHLCVTRTEAPDTHDSTVFATFRGDLGRAHQIPIPTMFQHGKGWQDRKVVRSYELDRGFNYLEHHYSNTIQTLKSILLATPTRSWASLFKWHFSPLLSWMIVSIATNTSFWFFVKFTTAVAWVSMVALYNCCSCLKCLTAVPQQG
jgi:hypothetical protein